MKKRKIKKRAESITKRPRLMVATAKIDIEIKTEVTDVNVVLRRGPGAEA